MFLLKNDKATYVAFTIFIFAAPDINADDTVLFHTQIGIINDIYSFQLNK